MTAPNIRHPPPVRDLVWESPLVPVAVAVTIGLLIDRNGLLPVFVQWIGLAIAMGTAAGCFARWPAATMPALWVCSGWAAALYHHAYRHAYPADDIGWLAEAEPKLVRLRGWVIEEPTRPLPPPTPAFVPYPRTEPARSVLRVQQVQIREQWHAASGKAYLTAEGSLDGIRLGDEVEVFGWIQAPQGPANPGGFDWRRHLADQRIRAVVRVRRTSATVVRLEEGWPRDFWGRLAWVRAWGRSICEQNLPDRAAGLAIALILGDSSAMRQSEWEKYILTGVLHVLAISGQHLVILGALMGWGLRQVGVRRRPAAVGIAVLLMGYALLTGFRPPVQRAAIASVVACLAIFARRVPLPANTFALAWLLVIILNPTDIFQLGCQLSFLQVAVLIWGADRLRLRPAPDAAEQWADASRPTWLSWPGWVRRAFGYVAGAYALTAVLAAVAMPLVAARQNVVSLSGFVLGPPLILLSTVALASGFLMLLLAPLGISTLPAWVMRQSLLAGEALVDWGVGTSWGHLYVPAPADWWVWGFYLGLLLWLWGRPGWSRPGNWLSALSAWLALLVALPLHRPTDALRITFLAVGHGGCTVIETPDGRVLLYDAGAMTGPDVTRRHIAPFLWSRGYTRIDEVFLSHADLDHFNGVVDLIRRFRIGRIHHTPTFAEKSSEAVRQTLAAIDRRGIARRFVWADQCFDAGFLSISVLHPPEAGPPGPENARSLVLQLEHQGHVVLLTGDLDSTGLERLLSRSRGGVDVLMAPHHGSRTANTTRLAEWAKPRLVVVSGGKDASDRLGRIYHQIPIWDTTDEGAITLRSHATGLVGETYRTGRRLVLRTGTYRTPED